MTVVARSPPSDGRRRRLPYASPVFVAAAAMLIAANLRPALTGVGPVLEDIREDTGMSAAAAGLLTTLPLLAFGLISPVAPPLARRVGTERVLQLVLVVLAVGLLLRSAGPIAAIFAGTVLLGTAIAVGNVLLPGLVKQEFPERAGLVTALYSTTMVALAGLASGLAVPLAETADLGWRGSLASWSLLALVSVGVWWPYARRSRRVPPADAGPAKIRLRRSPLAWDVTLFMGMQSALFYGVITWLPTVLVDDGMSATTAGWMLGLMQLASLVTTMVAPILAGRRASQEGLIVASSVLTLSSFMGLWTLPTSAAAVWVILLGLGMGAQFSLALTFLVLRAVDARHTSALSGMAQSGGYLFAATAPVGLGIVHDVTGSWTLPLVMLAAAAAGVLVFGSRAGRDAQVGERARP
jgi:CP family cyanate transporter-like MFS transporter